MAKRGRPLVPDEDLLHPRQVRVRKNVLKGERLTDKLPSKALVKLYGGIVEEAIVGVLSQPSRENNKSKKNKIDVTFPKKHKFPEAWPKGRIVKWLDGMITRAYTCEQIVLWGYQWNYCQWMPSDLYRMRIPIMHKMNALEKELDISFLEEDNETYEQGEEND